MSDVDETDDDGAADEGNAPKALRQQNSKLSKQLADLQKELDTLRVEKKTNTIADTLREKGANPKLAKYVSRDLEGDVTADAVAKWLEDEGELFGYTPGDAEPDEAEVQQKRISDATANASQPTTGWTPERIKAASNQQLIEAGLLDP